MINLKRSAVCLALLLSGLCLSYSVSAQTLDKEVGVRFSGLNDFDLVFKKELKENRWLRTRAVFSNVLFSKDNYRNTSATNFSFGLGLGYEFRKPLSEKVTLIHGPEANFNYGMRFTDFAGVAGEVSGGLGYVAGLQYDFNSSLSLGVEVVPSIFASFEQEETNTTSRENLRIGAGLQSNAAALTLMFRFPRRKKR